jgi:hypothetical protein
LEERVMDLGDIDRAVNVARLAVEIFDMGRRIKEERDREREAEQAKIDAERKRRQEIDAFIRKTKQEVDATLRKAQKEDAITLTIYIAGLAGLASVAGIAFKVWAGRKSRKGE